MTAESNPPHALAERDGRALLEAMPDSLFVLSREGICLDYHAAKSDVRPAPPEQFLGRAVRDMLPGQIAERLEASLARVLQTGNSETLEYPLTAAGETRYYEARVVLYDCEQVLVIARDITQRKQVEADLRAQEQLFEHLVAVARATAERPMLADTLQNALDIAMALTGATDGNLILLDSVGQITHNILPSSLASPAERENQVAFIMDKGLAGWVAEHHEAALIVDTLADERRLTLPDARSHFRSALSAPILSGPTLMGVLTLAHTQPGHFSQQHLRLIKAASDEITLAVRNAEMFEEQRHMAERQITLYQVLRTVSGLPDSNQVAQLAVDAIVRFAGWSQAALIIPSEDNTQWVIRAASGYLAPALGMARPIEQGIVGRALRTGRTQVVPDVRADPDYVAGHERTRSEVIVPLQRSNHTLGALSLNSDRVAGFDSDDLVLAESLADAIALALDSARLYEQMQQRAADMSALYAITRTTSRSLAIEEVLEQALSSALSLLGFNAGLIALVESEGSGQRHVSSDNLRLAAARGLPAELVEHFQRGGLQDTLTAYVYQSRESLVIQDSQREMSPEIARFADHLLGHGYRAFAGIPLLHQGQALGAMSLVAREPRSSSVYDTALLGTLGQQIAGAVANAKLFQATLAGRSRLQALINASRDGILLLGMDGRILILNAPALKLLRLPGEAPEWLGRELKDVLALLRVLAPNAARAALAERRQMRRGNGAGGQGELAMPPHTIHWIRLPVMTGTLPQGHLIVLYDVTDERAIEQLREDMTHTMVHDLRNPLSSITSALEMITEGMMGDVPPEQLELLQIAQHSAHRMLELVNSILDVSRLESGRMPLKRRTLNLAGLVDESLKAQAALANERNIRLENNVPASLPPAWADANMIGRVLQNLIGNAVKFTPAGGLVRVAASREKQAQHGQLVVQVSDTGLGIPPEIQSRLFQKFVSGRQPERGSGLGLAFCKLALEAHGERIWVESTPGQGATFSFSLALAPSGA